MIAVELRIMTLIEYQKRNQFHPDEAVGKIM